MTDWAEEKAKRMFAGWPTLEPITVDVERSIQETAEALREIREKALAEAATVIRSQDTQQELEQLLSQAHEQGRLEGLEEAAKATESGITYLRDCCRYEVEEGMRIIRALAAQKKEKP